MIKKFITILSIVFIFTSCSNVQKKETVQLTTYNQMLEWVLDNCVWKFADKHDMKTLVRSNLKSLSYEDSIRGVKYIDDMFGTQYHFVSSNKTFIEITSKEGFKEYMRKTQGDLMEHAKEQKVAHDRRQKIFAERREREEKARKIRETQARYKSLGADTNGYQLNGVHVDRLSYNAKYDQMKHIEEYNEDRSGKYRMKDGKLFVSVTAYYKIGSSSWERMKYIRYKELKAKAKILNKVFQMDNTSRNIAIESMEDGNIQMRITEYGLSVIERNDLKHSYDEMLKSIHAYNLKIVNKMKADKLAEQLL